MTTELDTRGPADLAPMRGRTGLVMRSFAVALLATGPLLPGDGRLLVEVPAQGSAIVQADGDHRLLGEWYDADWSPDGTRIAAVRGGTLAALDEDGRVRWRVRGAEHVSGPRWAPDGMKVAYRRGSPVESRGGAELRVVEADGSGDRRLARGLGFAGPAWQPGKGYAVAWADRAGRVRLRDAVGGRTLWRTAPGPPVRGLAWSRVGTTVAAWSGTSVRVIDGGSGRVLRVIRARGTNRFEAAAFLSSRLLLARHDIARGGSRVLSRRARRPGTRSRMLFAGRGRVVDLTPSPDGAWVLLGWRGGDEWRLLGRGDRERRVRAVTRRFTPGAGRWAFPYVRAWRVRELRLSRLRPVVSDQR
jgi:hypothetical protein